MLYIYYTYALHMLYIYCTISILHYAYTSHMLYIYYSFTLLYIYYTFTYYTYTIHILYIYCTYTIHLLYYTCYIYDAFTKFHLACYLGWNLNCRLARTHELLASPTKHILRRCYPRLPHNQLASSKQGSFNLPNFGGIRQAANGQF